MRAAVPLAVLAVVVAVVAAADLPDRLADALQSLASANVSAAEVNRTARRIKYIADGATHALLLAVCLFFAQRAGVRGYTLIVLASAAVYGMLHGVFQAACGYAAYFGGGGLLAPPGGLCERSGGWEPIVLAVAFGVVVTLIGARRADT